MVDLVTNPELPVVNNKVSSLPAIQKSLSFSMLWQKQTWRKDVVSKQLSTLPWWFLGIVLIAIWTFYVVVTQSNFREAFLFIKEGITITITTTVSAYGIALVLGLIAGLGRISKNIIFRNLSTLYVEVVRGIPMLVLIFYLALVGVPMGVTAMNQAGIWFNSIGLSSVGAVLNAVKNDQVSMNLRAIIALAVAYGAFQAEIFRAGIQSIDKGQTEAARSLGMSYIQTMRTIILPQAIRNVLPALANDFVSMVKDSALVSVLAVRDVTQIARLYAGRTFRFQEAYSTLAVLYLTMTVILSMFVKVIEKRFQHD